MVVVVVQSSTTTHSLAKPQTYKQPTKYEKHPKILKVLAVRPSYSRPFTFTDDGTHVNALLSCEATTEITTVASAQTICQKKTLPKFRRGEEELREERQEEKHTHDTDAEIVV